MGWHRVGRSKACVNPRDKSAVLSWRRGDVLLVAIDPNMRAGSLLDRTRALKAHRAES